jgi:2-dehydro-3-deoxyphosphooctonate aldolase (KDO 8-P synthase)
LLQAACETDKIVNIKKGQFLAPWDMKGILTKTEGAKEVWITERGTSFGYNTLVVDFTGLDYMLNNYDYPVVLDATHSVQKPGGNGGSSGGNRDYVPGLCRAGSALGIRNFFLEVHPNPDNAPSDGPNMLRLDDFEKIVADIVAISKVVE